MLQADSDPMPERAADQQSHAERQIIDELLRKEAAIAASLNGIAITDTEGHLTYVNRAFLDLWGYVDESQVLGRPAISFWNPPEAAAEVIAALQHEHAWFGELSALHNDGSTRSLQVNASLFYDSSGSPLGMVASFLDISKRKQAEEALRIRDQAIITALNAIIFTDPDGKTIYVNPAFLRLWGYDSAEDVLGKLPLDFIEPAGALEMLAGLRQYGTWQGELVGRRKNGSSFDGLAASHVVYDGLGKPLNMVGSILDISEAKRLQIQFLQAQKMESIGRLAGGVAHDFNNLLTVIKGYVDLAQIKLDPQSSIQFDLEQIHRAIDSAVGLTQQLLAFSRQQVIIPQVINLNEVILRVQKILHRLLGEDIVLQTSLAEQLPNIYFDPGQIEQIIFNLAVNARDAMPNGGTLSLATTVVHCDNADTEGLIGGRSGDYVVLHATDNGIGMSTEVRTRLFEPFFTTKNLGKGTGLGLAMIYGAISQNGGHIEVASQPDQGTCFTIYLPQIDALTNTTVSENQPPPLGNSQQVLLVEDNDAVRTVATRMLTTQDYQVYAFRNGEEALEAAGRLPTPPDLLISDVIMPGMNGRVLAELLSAIYPNLRVLFTSGYTADVIAKHGVLEEGIAFLQKPYALDSLARKVCEVLDR